MVGASSNRLYTMTDKGQTRPLVREGARIGQDRNWQKVNKPLVMSPRWSSTPRHTDWPTVSRKGTLTQKQQLLRHNPMSRRRRRNGNPVSNETVNMVMGPSRPWPVSDMHCKIQTRPLIREDALYEEGITWRMVSSGVLRRVALVTSSQNTQFFVVTAVKTSNLTRNYMSD
jgi:hypothetical protein